MSSTPAPLPIIIKPWSARRLIRAMSRLRIEADFIHVDAPWLYSGGKNNTQRGLAGWHYDGMSELDIALEMGLATAVAKPDSYMAFWCTFPKLREWFAWQESMDRAGWHYITGGVWGKTNKLGTGYHLRGDAELILIYKRGKPQVQVNDQSDLWMFDTPPSLLWTAERRGHSVKPLPVLRDLVAAFCPPGGLVLDLYTGAHATMPSACRGLYPPRACIGCEIDEERWRSSMHVLSQGDLFDANQYSREASLAQLDLFAGLMQEERQAEYAERETEREREPGALDPAPALSREPGADPGRENNSEILPELPGPAK